MNNQTKKTELKNPVILLIMLSISLIFASCEQDPVTPPLPDPGPGIIDSNLLDWDVDTLFQDMCGPSVFIADTNLMYIPTVSYFIKIYNKKVTYKSYQDNDFAGFCVSGADMNNIYFGGGSLTQRKSKLKYFNGFNIKDIVLPLDSSGGIFSFLVISPIDIWMSTKSSIVYRYFNQTIITYKVTGIEGLVQPGVMFKDIFGNIFLNITGKIPNQYSSYYLYNFKFENDNFVKVSKDSINEDWELRFRTGYCDNSDKGILYSGKSALYYFNETYWEKYIPINQNIYGILRGSAINQQNVLFVGSENQQTYFYYYNGNKLFRTPEYIPSHPGLETIANKFGRFYILTAQDWRGNSFLCTSKFKNF